jgi:hypothetical protein
MPARDIYHDAVKSALIKDGWVITADPYTIKYKDTNLFADLAAERVIAAEQQGRKIVVEVKSFLGPSLMRDFENALGQYILYRNLLSATAPEYQLYLAVKESTYESFFKLPSIQLVVAQNNLLIIVVDMENEEILKWIS